MNDTLACKTTKAELLIDNEQLRNANADLEKENKSLTALYKDLAERFDAVLEENKAMHDSIKTLIAPAFKELIQGLYIETTDKDGWTDITLKYDGLELSTDSIHTENY